MKNLHLNIVMAFALTTTSASAIAQEKQNFAIEAQNSAYADIADIVTIAPIIADLQIRKIRKLPETQTTGVPANIQRVLVEADIISLLRGQNGIAGRVRFLIDLPKDDRGKIPKLKKQRFFAMAKPVKGRADMIQLIRPDAMVQYSEENNEKVRAVTKEAVRIDAPQKITGIASAYYSQGTILGEGETQIFLTTENNQPFGLSVVSRDGQKQWTVSTSEIITDAEPAPQRNTLLWYRLACGLPKQLPPTLVGSGESANAAKAQADYRFVVDSLGPCGRKRPLRER